MNKPYAIAELKNIFETAQNRKHLIVASNLEVVKYIFDDLETVFKLYLLKEGYTFTEDVSKETGETNDQLRAKLKSAEYNYETKLKELSLRCKDLEEKKNEAREYDQAVIKASFEQHEKLVNIVEILAKNIDANRY